MKKNRESSMSLHALSIGHLMQVHWPLMYLLYLLLALNHKETFITSLDDPRIVARKKKEEVRH